MVKLVIPEGIIYYQDVVVGPDHGHFFAREFPADERHGYHAAVWTCDSSYGTYSYHWTSMGMPFPDFIKKIRNDYLINKIGQKIRSVTLFKTSVLKQLQDARFERRITTDQAKESREAIRRICNDASPEHLPWEEVTDAFKEVGLEFEPYSIDAEEWSPQARAFVEKLWPAFVEAVNNS